MTVSPMAAAKHMCARSGWELTNLSLQKMLYIAQMIYMGEHEQARDKLISGHFEAWAYGPVIPSVYGQVKAFGKNPIKNVFHGVPSVVDPAKAQALNEAYDQLASMTPGQLVSITHWQNGAWAKNYIPGAYGVPIPDADILDEYRQRAAAQAVAQH